MGTQLAYSILNSSFTKLTYYRAIMRERMNDDRLPKSVLVGQTSRAKRKAGRPEMEWEEVARKGLREIEVLWRV